MMLITERQTVVASGSGGDDEQQEMRCISSDTRGITADTAKLSGFDALSTEAETELMVQISGTPQTVYTWLVV